MTVCRFFVQGYCRYGDRCRFEHPDFQPHSNYENYNRQNLYEREYYKESRPIYDDSYAYGRNYGSHNRYVRDKQWNDTYRQNFNATPKGYGVRETFNQNAYRWVSSEYAKNLNNEYKEKNVNFPTSTPKAKLSFSFRIPESEIKNVSHTLTFEQKQNFTKLLSEDITAWEKGEQWPFSCYAPFSNRTEFPGFIDMSPEELRHEAYKAKENNSYNSYISNIANSLDIIKQKRALLKNPTDDILEVVDKINEGKETNLASPFPNNLLNISKDNTSSFLNKEVSKTAIESMQTDGLVDSIKSSTSFSFKVPSEISEQKDSIFQSTFSDIYTLLKELKEEDKEQFLSPTFTLGKIPTCPPPKELCF